MRNSIILMVLVFFVSPSYGETVQLRAKVFRVLADGVNFGGCMAALSPPPEVSLPGCKATWVTFSCSGDFMPKDVANRLYVAAQLGLVTGTSIEVRLNDAKKHNGYCLAERVDNFPQQP